MSTRLYFCHIFFDISVIARVTWHILKVSHQRAAAASVLHCDLKDEDQHSCVNMHALSVT